MRFCGISRLVFALLLLLAAGFSMPADAKKSSGGSGSSGGDTGTTGSSGTSTTTTTTTATAVCPTASATCYAVQGTPGTCPSFDCSVSTVLFPGTSTTPLQPFGDCYYVDNTSNNTYFVPLKTQTEWGSFKSNLPPGAALRSCSCTSTTIGNLCPSGSTSTGAHAYLYQLTPVFNPAGLHNQAGSVLLLTAADRIPNMEFYTTQINVPDKYFGVGFPGYPGLLTWFGVCYDGGYVAPTTGNYTFATLADDGVALYVDGNLISDYEDDAVYTQITTNLGNDWNPPSLISDAPVHLTAGTHTIMVKYYQAWDPAMGVQIYVQPPGGSSAIMQLTGPPNGTYACPH
jgi:hypothetical protein